MTNPPLKAPARTLHVHVTRSYFCLWVLVTQPAPGALFSEFMLSSKGVTTNAAAGSQWLSWSHSCKLLGHVNNSGLFLGLECLRATPLACLSCPWSLVRSSCPLSFPPSSWTTAQPHVPPPSGIPVSRLWAGPVCFYTSCGNLCVVSVCEADTCVSPLTECTLLWG